MVMSLRSRNGRVECKTLISFSKIVSKYAVWNHGPYWYHKAEDPLFVCFNAPISGTVGSNWKTIFVLDSPFIEEGYRLYYNVTLRPVGAEHQWKIL